MKTNSIKSPGRHSATKSTYHVNVFGVLVDEDGNRKPLRPGISERLNTNACILLEIVITALAMGFIYWMS